LRTCRNTEHLQVTSTLGVVMAKTIDRSGTYVDYEIVKRIQLTKLRRLSHMMGPICLSSLQLSCMETQMINGQSDHLENGI
jgi:hypothetical protein